MDNENQTKEKSDIRLWCFVVIALLAGFFIGRNGTDRFTIAPSPTGAMIKMNTGSGKSYYIITQTYADFQRGWKEVPGP
jgi:hypothetical protein